jgi:hypothetical protein
VARWFEEPHARRCHAGVITSEVVGLQEQEDPTAGLIADPIPLAGISSTGEQQAGRAAGRGDDDPTLVRDGLIRRELEPERAGEERDRLVVLADEVAEEAELRHAAIITDRRRVRELGRRATIGEDGCVRARSWGKPAGAAALVSSVLVIVATRTAPQLSPDSVTYLSAADHLRRGLGLTDFTGAPMTVFPPLYPALLALGGTSLGWVRAVGALAAGAAAWLMFVVLRHRIRPGAAAAGALAFGASQGVVRVASTAWSEAPYAVIALGMLVVLGTTAMSPPRAALGGLLAGAGFLTRYAGVGLVVTGAVMVVAASSGDGANARRSRLAHLALFGGAAGLVSGGWVAANIARTGEPFGPRFEGGAGESAATLARRALLATGELIVGDSASSATRQTIAATVLLSLAVAVVVSWRRRHVTTLDTGVLVFAVTSLAVPVLARAVTASDIEYRVMSPMLIPLVYATVLVVDHLAERRDVSRTAFAAAAVGLLAVWVLHGAVIAARFPDDADLSTGSRTLFSPALYDAVDELPDDVLVVTNFPQGLWWQTRREPTLFAFTRPRPGNSHVPLTVEETVAEVCGAPTYLAWFSGLRNAGEGPEERRPDVLAEVELVEIRAVAGGQLYRLEVRDPASCPASGA